MRTRLKGVRLGGLGSQGLSGAGLYHLQRKLLARWTGLPPALNKVEVERNIAIPAYDGVSLMTDHYYPAGRKDEKLPAILMRTPYGRGYEVPHRLGLLWTIFARTFAGRGYHVISQTVRGCFDSGGEFRPRDNERHDGQATLEWISRQSWFNGQVGTWGQSYLGFVQWAVSDSPLLKALVPVTTSSQSYPVPYPDGIFSLDLALNWTYILNSQAGLKNLPFWKALTGLSAAKREKDLAPAFLHLPVSEADQVGIGHPVQFFRQWLNHPDPASDYWKRSDDSRFLPQVQAPVHLVSGWYDFMLRELLADYRALVENGRPVYLTVGPWFHVSSGLFLEGLRAGLDWFDAQLKGEKGRLRSKPVRYYMMGANEWREADCWPPPASPTRYYLQENNALSTAGPPPASAPDRYLYDPANPTPSVGGPLLTVQAGPRDNRELEARPDVLVYTTAPLDEPVEIGGWVRLELYVKSSLEHTDFFGRLCDVQPDGRSINICDGIMRVEPGKGEPQQDGSLKLDIGLWATAHRFLPGHALRLQVSSGAHPRWNRNLGTGEPADHATRMQAAEQAVFHDAAHPSALVLPVV